MTTITLKNVRLSFPQIWTPKAYMEGQTAKYSANLLLDKDADKEQIEKLTADKGRLARDVERRKKKESTEQKYQADLVSSACFVRGRHHYQLPPPGLSFVLF